MNTKYIVNQNNLSEKLVESINSFNNSSDLNIKSDLSSLKSITSDIKYIESLEPNSNVLIPVFFRKNINGNYFVSENEIKTLIDELSDKFLLSDINILFSISHEEDHISLKLINDYLSNRDCINNFYYRMNSCLLTQSSLLSVFSNKLISRKDFLEFIAIFKNITHSGNEDPNFHFLTIEKLDRIDQQLEVFRNLPFYFRTNSIFFRLVNPFFQLFNKTKNKLKHQSTRAKSKFVSFIYKKTNTDILDLGLNKFFKIVGKTISKQQITIVKEKAPLLSIIIPVYGKLEYLKRCLYSIGLAKSNVKYEVIIVDDCGPEKVIDELKNLTASITIHTNSENIGFGNSCNKGAELAKGKFLCFLNSDTIVTDNWSDHLINSFSLADNVGIAGSKLIYEDGSIQEAGGIVFSDGGAANIGNKLQADNSWYKYYKDVDYVSGAALCLLKEDFNQLSGFDRIFSPAYYEDTSLCLDVRHKLNKRVVVNPMSIVIHHEGATNGKTINKGFKKYLTVNKEKFKEKHSLDLVNYSKDSTNLWWDRDKYIKGNILIIDQCIPTPNEDSGSKDMDNIINALLQQNYRPHFFALSNRSETPGTYSYYEKGVHCIFGSENINFNDFYEKYNSLFSLVIISRVNSYKEVYQTIEKYNPKLKTIFYTVDLHHVRMETEYEETKILNTYKQAQKTKLIELKAINNCTKTVVLSKKEKEYLQNECQIPSDKLITWPLIRSEFETITKYKKSEDAKDIIFIGGYRHAPNIEAVKYIDNVLMPKLIQIFEKNNIEFPGIKLYGSNPSAYIENLDTNNIKYMGYIENEADAFAKAKISIAPIPFGAGLKGKTLSSLIYKTPIIGSSFACEGFESYPDVLINSSLDPLEFSRNVFETYVRADLINNWDLVINDLETKYSYNSFLSKMKKDLEDLN